MASARGSPSAAGTAFTWAHAGDRGNLVLIMDVAPGAESSSTFFDAIVHRFRLRTVDIQLGPTSLRFVPGPGDSPWMSRSRPLIARSGDSRGSDRLNCHSSVRLATLRNFSPATSLLVEFPGRGCRGMVAADCAGDDRAVEVCAELGEDGFDATDSLS